mgnify:CR=1 FL=1
MAISAVSRRSGCRTWAALAGFTAITALSIAPDFYLGLYDRLTGSWATEWTPRGILALAAAKLGAARVTGTDIDPHAMDAARYNAERNGATLELLHSRENIDHTADVVVANILANPLTVLAPLLCGLTRSGGRIALSGILAAQTDMVRAAYRPAFELEVAGEREGWVLLTGTRV